MALPSNKPSIRASEGAPSVSVDGATSSQRLRLLCDEMLGGLARWLRAAGYDTAMAAPGDGDAAVRARARAEGRVLLTRDAALARAAGDTVRLRDDGLNAQARALAATLGLDWTAAPFTRCLVDNTPLRTAAPQERDAAPAAARALAGPFTLCPACGRLYWPGSHVRRMRERLERWAAGG